MKHNRDLNRITCAEERKKNNEKSHQTNQLVIYSGMSMAVQAKSKKNVPTSGKCGKYATWTYDKSTKILKIQGHGKLVSPSKYWPDPWNLLEIKKVEF